MRNALVIGTVFALLLAAGSMLPQTHGADLTEKQAIDLIKAANDGQEVPGLLFVVRLSAAEPGEVIAALHPLFGRRGVALAFDAKTSSLVMAGPEDVAQVMRGVIVQLDEAAGDRKKAGPGKYSPVTLTIHGTGTIVVDEQGFHVQPTAEIQPTSQPAARTPPITFARSGRMVAVAPMLAERVAGKVVLRAFGRTWTEPADAAGASILEVPNVRVPTVFAITPAGDPNTLLGQLVAYPDRDVDWDKKIALYSCSAPAWFNQWASATGLPVKQVLTRDLATAKLSPADEKGKSLLILGSATAGKDLADVAKLAGDQKINILVLDAGWFGESAGAVSIAPAQMLGGLSDIASQRWPQPLKFASRRKPWPGIANRWAWITDDSGLPLVEQVMRDGSFFPCVVLNYVPWMDQLGRREQADEVLPAMLTAAARLETQRGFEPLEVHLLHPPVKDVRLDSFPVKPLSLSYRWSSGEPRTLFVLDLRGHQELPAELLGQCRKLEPVMGGPERLKESSLLILGDDKLLDEWEWLKLDRAKKRIGRDGVQWLSDDELPPSKENQIRLMLKLTELGVPLAPPGQQEKRK